jgi:dTDP-4-dehydrorhamnose 3,5-epimerase
MNLSSITLSPLQRISTPGGDVLRGLKNTDSGFTGFGEAYFSIVDFNNVKAWKRHLRMTMNLIVPQGEVRFVFFDDVSGDFMRVDIGQSAYQRITVPPMVWFGFQGLSKDQNLILNIASIPHDSAESERLSLTRIEYDWNML